MKTEFRITPEQIAAADFQYFNLIAAYMLHSLATSQSMSMLLAGFKSVKGLNKLMPQLFPALEDGVGQPALPARLLPTLCPSQSGGVCFKSDDDMFKGRAATFYEKGAERPPRLV